MMKAIEFEDEPDAAVKWSAAQWQQEYESQFEHRVVRYLMKRYGLGEVGSTEIPEDPGQRWTLQGFREQHPRFPIWLEGTSLQKYEVERLRADKLLIFPRSTLLVRRFDACYTPWKYLHAGLFGLVFRMYCVAADCSLVAHNHFTVDADHEGPHLIITLREIGKIVMEPLNVLLDQLDREYPCKQWRGR